MAAVGNGSRLRAKGAGTEPARGREGAEERERETGSKTVSSAGINIMSFSMRNFRDARL